jgi:Ca2+-binding EF-hand superfamily protein
MSEEVPIEASRDSEEQADLPGFNEDTQASQQPEDDDGTEFVREHFEKICNENNNDELDKKGFKKLVNLLNEKGGINSVPKDADLEKAWTIADVDKSGLVDLDEFMALFDLIKQGLIDGIGKKSKWSPLNSSKGKAEVKKRRQIYLENLENRRKQNARKSAVGDGEKQILQEKKGRAEASQTLALAKNEWQQRLNESSDGKNVTTPQNIGSLDKQTEASIARGEKEDKVIGATELEMKNQKNSRQQASNTLALAKDEWESRGKITVAKKLGNFGNDTEAGKHRYDEMTVDNTGAAEMHILNQKNARQNASLALSDAKDEWEGRDKITIAQNIGNLATLTESGKHRYDEITHDNTGAAEIEILNQRTGRQRASLALSQAKDDWESRDKITVTDDIGNLATDTVSGKHRHDKITEDNTSAAELEILNRKNARVDMSKDLSKNKQEYSRRESVHQENAKAKFKAIDADDSGGLDLEEVREAAHLLKIEPDQVDEVFHAIDTNGDGVISLKEFLVYIGNMKTNVKAFKNASRHTRNSERFLDKKSAFVSSIEKDAKASKEIRNEMSNALQDAKNQWEMRQYKQNVKTAFNKQKSGSDLTPGSPRADLRSSEDKAMAKAREDHLRKTIAKRKANQNKTESEGQAGTDNKMVTLPQLKFSANALKLSMEEVEAIFEQLDQTKTGEIHIDDFMSFYSELSVTSMTLVTKPKTFKASAQTKSSSFKIVDKLSSKSKVDGVLVSSKRYDEKGLNLARKELLKRRPSIPNKPTSPRKKTPMKKKKSFGDSSDSLTPSNPPSSLPEPLIDERQGPLWFVPEKVAFWRDPGNASNDRKSKSPVPAMSPPRSSDSPATAYTKRFRNTKGSSTQTPGTAV